MTPTGVGSEACRFIWFSHTVKYYIYIYIYNKHQLFRLIDLNNRKILNNWNKYKQTEQNLKIIKACMNI